MDGWIGRDDGILPRNQDGPHHVVLVDLRRAKATSTFADPLPLSVVPSAQRSGSVVASEKRAVPEAYNAGVSVVSSNVSDGQTEAIYVSTQTKRRDCHRVRPRSNKKEASAAAQMTEMNRQSYDLRRRR